MTTLFRNRSEAGQTLATYLTAYADRDDVVVLALPRGGVPVAAAVARALRASLDVFVVRKLGVPGEEELAMGAIASGGVRVLNAEVLRMLDIPPEVLAAVTNREQQELMRREQLYRDHRPPADLRRRTAILIDDGLATGATMRAAVAAARQRQAPRIVVAVPVAAHETCERLRAEVDDLICPYQPEPFFGVSWWYDDFTQTTDAEVHDILTRAIPSAPTPREL